MKTTVVEDGQNGASVACTVSGSGPFTVDAQALLDADSLALHVVISPGMSQQAPAQGTISYSSAQTAGNAFGGTCSFWFTTNTPETVAPGKVWMTFACPGVMSGLDTCTIQQGYALFENCLTQ